MGSVTSAGARSAAAAESSEKHFYSAYHWCLNPVLSLRELLRRLDEELDKLDPLQSGWQQREHQLNLYLFICAVACTVDDYLAFRPFDLSRIGGRYRRLRLAAASAERVLNLPRTLRALTGDPRIVRFRREWNRCVNLVCGLWIHEGSPTDRSDAHVRRWTDLEKTLRPLVRARLPERLLARRMILPEAFRCQDLTHRDVVSLARRFAGSHQECEEGTVIIGVRTAGAYFAPLMAAYFSRLGWPRVEWFTIRPKQRLSRIETRRIRTLRRRNGRVLVVDDHPNTGLTLSLTVRILRESGVPPERITILVPRHQALPDWKLPNDGGCTEGVAVITLEPAEFHKTGLLETPSMESLLQEYFCDYASVRVVESREADAINVRLQRRFEDGFHVRLKRVFDVRLVAEGGRPILKRIVAKSTGWGWLGYHAHIIGSRLAGRVPPLIGLRNGLMISEWVGRADCEGLRRNENTVPILASYVACRAQALLLAEDSSADDPGSRWAGWAEMAHILRGAYGPYLGRLKLREIRRRLGQYASPRPAVVDGRMGPGEWIEDASGIWKVDFEHHNFGGAELDVVDPAYDLACAALEFALSEGEEQELLQRYARQSGDRAIADRILPYELLCGVLAMRRAVQWIARRPSAEKQEEHNLRYLSARNFLVFRMNRFNAGLMGRLQQPAWSKRLFLLDLDGVFDCELLGFPHTTPSGVAALALLQSYGIAVVPNTGRSVDHVWNYCKTFGLPGGLAEYGSVFVDAVGDREVTLGDPAAWEELVRCREALTKRRGVFVDPGYRYSVRAYRYGRERTVGLPADELQEILAECRCERVAFLAAPEDTYLVRKGTGKGPGARAVQEHLGGGIEWVAAIGDSEQDLEMLKVARISYVPANCSRRMRQLALKAGSHAVSQSFQRGLLAAARHLLRHDAAAQGGSALEPLADGRGEDLLRSLLRVAERPWHRQILSLLNWRGL